MATQKATQKQHGTTDKFQGFVRSQIEEAKGRFLAFERDAEGVLQNLVELGKTQRKELEHLVEKLNVGDFPIFEAPSVRALGKRANKASHEVRKRLDTLQARVVAASGVASQAQVKEINRELSKLAKKIDTLLTKKSSARA